MNDYKKLFDAADDYFEADHFFSYTRRAKFDYLVICLKKHSNNDINFLKSFIESIFHLMIEEKILNSELSNLVKYSKIELASFLCALKEELGVNFSEYTESLFNVCNKLMGEKISKKTKSNKQSGKFVSFFVLLDIIKDIDDVRFIKFVDLFIQSLPEGIIQDYGEKIFMFFIETKYPVESMDVLRKYVDNPPSDNDFVNKCIEQVYYRIRDNKQKLPGFVWINK